MTQKGVLMGPGFSVVDVMVPSLQGQMHGKDYSHLLPGEGEIKLCTAPFTELTGAPVVVVYRVVPPFSAPGNPMATRLTASLESGFGREICGPALAFYSEPGKDFSSEHWAELDNVIYGPFMDLFGSGTAPSKEELQQLANDYNEGMYKQESDSETDLP